MSPPDRLTAVAAALARPTSPGVAGDRIEAAITAWAQRPDTGDPDRRVLRDSDWIQVACAGIDTPAQGWKLHVSAGVDTAPAVLERVLHVLSGDAIDFKVASSVERLHVLNTGNGGPTQVGKFITIYPADSAQAVRLAVALHEATAGLTGPRVPSDRPLRPGSLVHYRYGAFRPLFVQAATGLVEPALRRPDGELVPDRRRAHYTAPDWVDDPFVAAGVVERDTRPKLLFAGRYLAYELLHNSSRSIVRRAVDLDTGARRVLKQARGTSGVETDASIRERLRHEADVLRRLAPDPRFPAAHDLFEFDGDLVLVVEDCAGETIERHVATLAAQGRFVATEQIVAWGRELAGALALLHDHGLVHSDVKSANVIITPDGHVRLVDFDSARSAGETDKLTAEGTPGYLPPERVAGAPPAFTDDVYALGALLYFQTTAAEPSRAPGAGNLLARPLELLNPSVDPALRAIIVRCLDADVAGRFSSMAELNQALIALAVPAGRAAGDASREQPATDGTAHQRCLGGRDGPIHGRDASHNRDLARRLGDALCATAEPVDGGLAWTCRHPVGYGMQLRDVNAGAAGTVLALADLVEALDLPAHRDTLAGAARALAASTPFAGGPLPGLFAGESGVGAALLFAGQALEDRDLIMAAESRGRQVAALPHASPDLFTGTAGRLRFHLMLWRVTSARDQIEAAVAAGEQLLATAERPGAGERCWRIPLGYEQASGLVYLGYAHGAAGIADTLLDLYQVVGDERYRAAAAGAGRWLARLAQRTGSERAAGLDWPDTEGGALNGGLWCHGALGVGRFFLHAARLNLLADAEAIALGAARTAARTARWAGPVLCHGLAGKITFLLDVYLATGDGVWLEEARALGRLVEAFAVERDSQVQVSSETTGSISPDFMVGYAGIAYCLLRLAAPDQGTAGRALGV
ncbi:MAG: protein kinase [Chloroflexi bacterium]|nr:protein kinase [Chloroflexota bacterium]